MPQRRRLSMDVRNRAVGMLQAGMTQINVARRIGVSPSVIHRLISRFTQTNSTADRPRTGRPRCTTPAQDCYLRTCALRSRVISGAQLRARLLQTGTRVSIQTVRKRLHSAGLRARRPYVGVVLTPRHRQARLAWVRQFRRWNNQQWASVLFTDESRYVLDMLDRRRRVWRRHGERYANCNVVQHDRYKGGSVMVWGGISVRSRTDLVVIDGNLTGQRYINEVLQPVVLPFLHQHQCQYQDHNARPHRARIVQDFFRQNNVVRIDWAARSPDMSPIEHVWDILGQRVRRRIPAPRTRQTLAAALQEEWRLIPQHRIARIIRSMRRRCESLFAANGGHTRY